jgi:hypothetical protein
VLADRDQARQTDIQREFLFAVVVFQATKLTASCSPMMIPPVQESVFDEERTEK